MTEKIMALIGKKFGKLTVIAFDHYGKSSTACYKCKCDCGNEVVVKRTSLIQGATKTCRMCSTRELIGKRFGKLVVTKYEGKNKNHSHTFECKCDCGGVLHNIPATTLLTGKTKSCGYCIVNNTIGKKYGHLTPIKLVPIPEGRKLYRRGEKNRYLCKCDCGNTTIVNGNSLRNLNIQTCGKCYHALPDSYKKEYYENCLRLSDIHYSIRSRCTNPYDTAFYSYGGRGIECRIDRWEFISTFYKHNIKGLEIDRINNDGHYEFGNVRWVTRSENSANRSFNQSYSFDMIAKRLTTLNSLHKINFKLEKQEKVNDDEWFIAEFNVSNMYNRALSLFIHYTLKDKIYDYINRIIGFYNKFGRDDVKCINIWKIRNINHGDIKFGTFTDLYSKLDTDVTYVDNVSQIKSNTVELSYKSAIIPEKQ